MTNSIIYHNFQNTEAAAKAPASGVVLTAPILEKGRRVAKFVIRVNAVANAACMFLCGACSAVGLVILLLLVRGS